MSVELNTAAVCCRVLQGVVCCSPINLFAPSTGCAVHVSDVAYGVALINKIYKFEVLFCKRAL